MGCIWQNTLKKNVKAKASLSRCLLTAKKEFVIQLLILYDSLRPIFVQESEEIKAFARKKICINALKLYRFLFILQLHI